MPCGEPSGQRFHLEPEVFAQKAVRCTQVGSFKPASSWVNALSWAPREMQGRGLLSAGCSDGSVRLAAFATEDLGHAPSPGNSLREPLLATLIGPDLNGVTSLDTAIQGAPPPPCTYFKVSS
jgi:hypothetical protein